MDVIKREFGENAEIVRVLGRIFGYTDEKIIEIITPESVKEVVRLASVNRAFVLKVKELRVKQKVYFSMKSHSGSAKWDVLKECQDMERELDKEIEQLLNPPQAKLF